MKCPPERRIYSEVGLAVGGQSREGQAQSSDVSDQSPDNLTAELKGQMERLQECICSLLIKNQKLRMALMEVSPAEFRSPNDTNNA